MRPGAFAAASLLLIAGLSAPAESFDFSFGDSSNTFTGSGVLTTGALLAPDEYRIVSVTGTVQTSARGNEQAIQSILPPDTFPTLSNGGSFPPNDNTLFVANGVGTLSQDGLSFRLRNGAQINLYDDGPGDNAYLERSNGATVFEDAPTLITAIQTTPEPSSLLLLGTGLLSVSGLWVRRARR